MRKNILISALLIGLFAFGGAAYPWGATGGDGSRAHALQETAVFYNNSGQTITEGMIVVIDTDGATAGTSLGSYVTLTNAVDASTIVGVVKSSSVINGNPVVVITKGPADTLVLDASDPVSVSSYVGTTATVGYGGACGRESSNAGYIGRALENGDGTDTGKVYIWVNPGVNMGN